MGIQKTPSQVFREARTTIQECGWTKGSYQRFNGQICLMGAINVTMGRSASGHCDMLPDVIREPLFKAIELVTGYKSGPENFNDASRTTEEHVLTALTIAEEVAHGNQVYALQTA